MQSRGGSTSHPTRSAPWGATWVGPVCGFVGALAVMITWRIFHWPYLRESSLALMFFLAMGVSAYRNGALRAHPVRVSLVVLAFAVLGAAMGHIPV